VYNIIQGIKNLIYWFPVIWCDRDWDYNYIIVLLYHKFRRMEKFYRGDKVYSANSLKTAKQLSVVKNLCKRLSNSNYLENAMYCHDKKYEEYDFEFESLGNGWSKLIPDPNIQRSKSFRKCGNHADYMEKQDLDYLFKYMRKHIQKWWD
jgi:hypothetical protein